MIAIIRKRKDGRIKSLFLNTTTLEAIAATSAALGKLAFNSVKEGHKSMETIQEISDEVLIPSFLEGFGCRRIEEEEENK